MNNYCIYIHKNKINGKVYIGQTCQKPQYRWNHGQGYKQCPYFYSAIKKYGWNNFEHIILKTNLSSEQANLKEQYYIKLYQSNNEKYGYNLTSGGANPQNLSEKTHQKLSEHAKKLWTSKEHKEKMSKIMKEKWKDSQYREKVIGNRQKHLLKEGKSSFLSEKSKKKISEARKKYIAENGAPRSRKVKCIETNEIFQTLKSAAAWCGFKDSTGITKAARGYIKSAGKHPLTKQPLHWQYID